MQLLESYVIPRERKMLEEMEALITTLRRSPASSGRTSKNVGSRLKAIEDAKLALEGDLALALDELREDKEEHTLHCRPATGRGGRRSTRKQKSRKRSMRR